MLEILVAHWLRISSSKYSQIKSMEGRHYGTTIGARGRGCPTCNHSHLPSSVLLKYFGLNPILFQYALTQSRPSKGRLCWSQTPWIFNNWCFVLIAKICVKGKRMWEMWTVGIVELNQVIFKVK